MADTTPYPLVNGNAFGWASAEIILGVFRQLGITSINYKRGLKTSIVYGAGSNPIAFTQGQAELSGDFEMLLNQYQLMVQDLGDGWMSRTLGDIVVSYDEPSGDLLTIVHTLIGVRVTDVDEGIQSSSTDAAVVKLTYNYLKFLENGINPMPTQPTSTQ
jgi:hypothetical protein